LLGRAEQETKTMTNTLTGPNANCGPNTEHGKAIASRNATTHGVFSRDIVLTSLGEDPGGYQQVQDELVAQLRPGNLLERHYVEKIAAASWRLRRLHRWQAQLFEDDLLTEDTRLDKLDKVLRHETALQRQIDTAVRMLAKDVPQLYAGRARAEALDSLQLSERECQDDGELDMGVAMEARNRLYQIRKSTNQAVNELSVAPLDTPAPAPPASTCPSPATLPFPNRGGSEERVGGVPAPLSVGQTAAGSSAQDFNPGAFLHGATTSEFAKTNPSRSGRGGRYEVMPKA
jgi:hypothetical protein